MKHLLFGLLLTAAPPLEQQPLPNAQSFSRSVPAVIFATLTAAEMMDDKTIRFDAAKLRHFRYTEKETRVALDSKGNVKKTDVDVYEVIRGPEVWQIYRRQISRNGIPLTEKELQQQDREQKKWEQEELREAKKQAQARRNARPPDPAHQKKEEDELIRLFSDMYEIQVAGREVLHERPTILLTFNPKPGFKTKDTVLKLLHHLSLRAWLTEQNHEIVKIECTLLEPVSLGLVLAKFQSGSKLVLERQMVREGLWAPSRIDATVRARILLVKGLNERQIMEYSDFKEYSVETILRVEGPVQDE